MTTFKKIIVFLLIGFLSISCSDKMERNSQDELTSPKVYLFLNSVFTLDIRDDRDDNDIIMQQIQERLEDIENKLSIHLPSSEISSINQNAGKNPTKVSEETVKVIEKSREIAKITEENNEGRFDIRIGALSSLWNIGTASEKVPTSEEIKKALLLVGADMTVDKEKNQVYLSQEGMKIDLGASAKGYATDEVVKILKEHDVKNAIVDLGGNIYIHGDNGGQGFKVGIQDPSSTRGEYMAVVNCSDTSIVTSGIYERYFEENGKRYHHILSASTGYPVDNDIVSVTVITPNSMKADILSTSFYLLGIEKSLDLVNSMEDVEVVFLDKNDKIHISENLRDNFSLNSSKYQIINEE